MDPPIEIEDSPDQTDYPIILVDVFNPVEIDLLKQTDEASREKRRNWVDAIWNIDSKKFPLLKYRIRYGKDPKKVVWKQQKVADILRKHFSVLKVVKETKEPTPSVTIKKEVDPTPPPCQLAVEMEAYDAEFRKTYSYPVGKPTSQEQDIKPSLKRKFTSSTGRADSKSPPANFKRKIEVSRSESEPDNPKIVLEPSDDEEQVDYRKTYVFPEDTSVTDPNKPCSSKTGLRMTVETSSCKRKVQSVEAFSTSDHPPPPPHPPPQR